MEAGSRIASVRRVTARSTNPARFGILFNTCMRGHEFTPANTYISPNRSKGRSCRTCAKERARQSRLRTKEDGDARRI